MKEYKPIEFEWIEATIATTDGERETVVFNTVEELIIHLIEKGFLKK
jgi:hypothetical protein